MISPQSFSCHAHQTLLSSSNKILRVSSSWHRGDVLKYLVRPSSFFKQALRAFPSIFTALSPIESSLSSAIFLIELQIQVIGAVPVLIMVSVALCFSPTYLPVILPTKMTAAGNNKTRKFLKFYHLSHINLTSYQ